MGIVSWAGTPQLHNLSDFYNQFNICKVSTSSCQATLLRRDIHGAKVKAVAAGNIKLNYKLLNVILIALALALLVWYTGWTNYLGVSRYRETELQSLFSQLNEVSHSLLQQKSEATDLNALISFSHRLGLVEQKTANYVLNQDGVAQGQNKLSP